MKHMYTCIISLFLISAVNTISAEDPLLSQVKKRYTSETTIKAEFSMKTWWNVREREQFKKGSATIAPGDKFRISLGNDLFISNGREYYQYNSASKQLQINNLADIDLSIHPSRLFTSFLTDYPLKETQRINKEVLFEWSADSSSKKPYELIKVAINADKTIREIKLTDKNNNVFTYTFKKTEFGGTVPEGAFKFEQPSDAQVVDKR